MSIAKLHPYYKQTVWGGNRLKDVFGKPCTYGVGESWELSAFPHCESMLEFQDGQLVKLSDYVRQNQGSITDGFNARSEFPLLIKFIDSADDLSIQVHPTRQYASTHCEVKEKNELWRIVKADKDSVIGYGFNRNVDDTMILEAIKTNTLENLMNFIPVYAGDLIYIPAGTVHCIGKGVLLAEIQQNSDSTFRMYDFGRCRALNIDEALQCCDKNRVDVDNVKLHNKDFTCDFFKCFETAVNGRHDIPNTESFKVIMTLDGEGEINSMQVSAGDCVFIPANVLNVSVSGNMNILTVYLK